MKCITSLVCVIFLCSLGISQSKITLVMKVMDEETACFKDSTEKNILFQYRDKEEYKDINHFSSYKCLNKYNITRFPGQFRLLITSQEHEPLSIDFEINQNSSDTLDLGEFYLFRKEMSLGDEKDIEEITIMGQQEKFIKFEANKTTYSVKDNDLLSGGSTEEALQKIPGVIKGFGGEMTVNGKSMAIYIDDSPTGLSGDDLENLLQSIPASSIEKIEIINNPGASYEANTAGGIINIITNGKALTGINGTASLNYRFNRNTRVSPSVNINSRIKDVSLQLNAGFTYREWERITLYNREFTSFQPSVIFNQDNKDKGYNRYYFFRPSANIRLNDNSNLLVNYNFTHTHNNNYYTGESYSYNSINPIHLLNNSKPVNDNSRHEVIAKYKTRLDTLGNSFDVTAYYSRYDKNNIYQSIQNNRGVNRYSVSDVDSEYDNFYAKANLDLDFEKIDMSLKIGGKYGFMNSSSAGKYHLLSNSASVLEYPDYKSYLDFDYNEHQYAVYAELNKNIKKLSVTAGLRYENLKYKSLIRQSDDRIDNGVDQFYPSVGLLYKFSPVVNLNASYRKSISLPSYTKLDPNLSGYFDEYNMATGNRYLQPDYYDNYEVSISAFNYLRLGFQYTYSKNINLLHFEAENNSLVVNQTTRTFHGMRGYNISLGIPVPLGLITKGKKFFDEPINVDKLSFIYFYGMYNYYKLDDYPYTDKVKPLWFYAFYSQIVLPKNFKLTAFYMFSSDNGYFRIYKANKPFNYSNFELSRTFYDKAFRAAVGVDNLFNSSKLNAGIFSPNLNTNFYQRDKNRLFYFKLSYNFGKLRKLKRESTTIESDNKEENSPFLTPSLK